MNVECNVKLGRVRPISRVTEKAEKVVTPLITSRSRVALLLTFASAALVATRVIESVVPRVAVRGTLRVTATVAEPLLFNESVEGVTEETNPLPSMAVRLNVSAAPRFCT